MFLLTALFVQKFNSTTLDYGTVEQAMMVLKQQHKVISKKVLQNILEQRTSCNEEFSQINEVCKSQYNVGLQFAREDRMCFPHKQTFQ